MISSQFCSSARRAVAAVCGTSRGRQELHVVCEVGRGSASLVLLEVCSGRLINFGTLTLLQEAITWAAADSSERSLHRCAFLSEMLRRSGEPERLDFADVKLATYHIVPAIVRSLGMCLPSPAAWQALIKLCTAALDRLYNLR